MVITRILAHLTVLTEIFVCIIIEAYFAAGCALLLPRVEIQPADKMNLSGYHLGHERSLTQIKFNSEGDLLFSCSKDHVINVWYTHNGERLGTYDGNNGTVWTVDVDCA
jgi:WD40 repeat protein